MVGGELAVHLVVGGHEHGRVRGLEGDLEGAQVQLAQGALVDDRVDHHPRGLLVVRRVVLRAGGHPLGLDAAHERCGQHPGQVRVLGEVLEVAAAAWVPLEVQAGAEQDRHVLGAGLAAERRPDLLEQGRVPGAGQCRCHREARRGHGVVEPDVVGAARLLAQPVRPVGEHHGGDQALDRLGGPEVPPADQSDPVGQGQVRDDRLSPLTGGRRGRAGILVGRGWGHVPNHARARLSPVSRGVSPGRAEQVPPARSQSRCPGATPPCVAGRGAATELRARLRTSGPAIVSSAIR